MDDNFIKNNLEIIPAEKYKIEKLSATLHNIIPLADLQNDQIYQVKINDEDEEYNYSWAFQTKKKFEVEDTLPADNSGYVPANSGIEMYFSLSSLEEIDDYFEIKPHVDGRFTYKDNSVIFIPEKLEENTRYRVTIKKGYGLDDSDNILEEDYSFTFDTKLEKQSQIYFDEPLTNIYMDNAKIIEAYVNDENIEFDLKIYQFMNADYFAKNIKDFADTGKFLHTEGSIEDIEGLSEISKIKQKPVIVYKYNSPKALFELPDLEKGYYLLEFISDNKENYHFLQINDMLIYSAFFDKEIFVFAADGKNSQGIVDAAVVLNGDQLGFTDKSGVLSIDRDTSIYDNKTILIRVEAKGFSDFIYTDSLYYYSYYYRNQYEAYKYLRYIDTDRPVYMPTDTINVWGFARHKDDKSLNRVKIELTEADTNLILEEKTLDLTDIGTYQTEFHINNISTTGCIINVYDNDIKISSKYISISQYTKPLFALKGEFDKEFVNNGENINYKLAANFFDGYPFPNLELKYSTSFYNSYGGNASYTPVNSQVKLNGKGEAVIDVITSMISSNWRPATINMNVWNAEAEDKAVSIRNTFEIFPRRNIVEIEQNDINKPESIDILLHELDSSKYKTDEYKGYQDLRGKPLSDIIMVEIVESYYEKVKKGEHYDHINKVNVIDYNYNRIESTVYSRQINTIDGAANIQIPNFNPERSYKIIVFYDGDDGMLIEETYLGGYRWFYEKLYYHFERSPDIDNYRLNDEIVLKLKYNDETAVNTENDRLIVLLMRNGLVDWALTDSTTAELTFKEDYIPNVMINSVYIKNGYIYPVEALQTLYYDRTEKQIYLDVSTDKEEYRPGQEVLLNISAKDENNAPVIADINISVVDEAYFAIFEKNVDTLGSLYQYEWNLGLRKTYLSNDDLSMDKGSGAGMGGGGDSYDNFRDEFKDTNVFKTITTDAKGKGQLKFKLADNLTSWRISCQGISDKSYAGSEIKNIRVSLPFYVGLIMGKEYIKDDKISAALRVFGTEAKSSEEVNYEIKLVNKESKKEFKYSQTGLIGDYTNITFDKLKEGQYEIYVYAAYKDFEDGIKEEFKVVDSSIYFNNTNYYKLLETTVFDEVYSNPVLTLFNESSSDFYKSLNDIASSYGKRIDQTVCSMLAAKYINEYFETEFPFYEDELLDEIGRYEADEGYSLFTYSNTDTELTAKLMSLVDDEFLNAKAKIYFKRLLEQNDEYDTDIAAALWGLAKYKEPVLLTIYELLEKGELESRDKIYLSLALAELGDIKTAKNYYDKITKDSLRESGHYLYFESGTDDNVSYTENYELTALLSLLGVKVQDYNKSDKLFKYIYNNPSKYTLSNFEQLIYIMDRNIMTLDEIKDLFGEVTVSSEGKDKTYKLKLFDRENFSVPKEKIQDINFKNIKGSIACKVEALGNKDDLEKNKTDDFSIDIKYLLKDSADSIEQRTFNHSDVAKITIMPSFSSNVERGNYEITYVVPAGFRFIEIDRQNPFWVEENGQKLKFNFYYDKNNFAAIPITFYIQAVQTGKYTVDYVVIKENMETKLNFINKESLTIN